MTEIIRWMLEGSKIMDQKSTNKDSGTGRRAMPRVSPRGPCCGMLTGALRGVDP